MNTHTIYSSVDNDWQNYASKGDRVHFVSQGQQYQATVVSANLQSIIVTIPPSPKEIELKMGTFQFAEQRPTPNSVPIEVHDLIRTSIDGITYLGCIVSIDDANDVAAVDICAPGHNGVTNIVRQNIPRTKLSYLAKGYSFEKASQPPAAAQSASQIALLYPAPCVVMAVPFQTNPDSFPEAMYVQLPDRPGNPVLLPVVRMGCDTALVVTPNIRSSGTVNVTPLKSGSSHPQGQ